MRRSQSSEGVARPILAISLAALTVAARLPFLVTGKIAFDSDEAVEGLMARHVLTGELPAFFWGQAFKGVPEVYVSAGAFALFGSKVVVLKSVTLAFFAAYVALNFLLVDKLVSRWMAVASSLLLILAPPALVFWSLDASAEYVLVMLLGTTLLLLTPASREPRPGDPAMLSFWAGLVIGLGLWIHQLFSVYLVPLAWLAIARANWWRRREFGRPNMAVLGLTAVAGLYLTLGIVAFVTGGFSFRLGSISISVTAPQKMARIAGGVGALAVLLHLTTHATQDHLRVWGTRYWRAGAGFIVGYLPVILYTILVEPARAPARVADLRDLWKAAPDLFGNIAPILAGFKIATTERLPLPLVAAVPGMTALATYLWSVRRRVTREFFALFFVFVPVLFLASGAYLDTQSYRYLVVWYAGLVVAWAAGSLALSGGRPAVAAALVGAIMAVHAWQQIVWFRKLSPDTQSVATLECLKRNGIKGGFAGYWTAYKLTFLSNEEIIVAPTDGIDRYPKHSEYVRSLPPHHRMDEVSSCR